jgi:hypothetical protein
MIQRIQTLFFLLSALAAGLMLFNPLLGIDLPDGGRAILFADGVKDAGSGKVVVQAFPLLALIAIITLISIVTVFLYKKRMLQMRLTVYNLVLLVGLIVLGYYYARQGVKETGGTMELTYYTIMPVVAFILSLLGWRGVRRDYLMLKAVERIR